MTESHEGSDGSRGDQARSEEIEYCAHCGAKLPHDVWCPIRVETDTDGTLLVRSFCDNTCKDAWADDDTTGEHGTENSREDGP